MLVAKEKIAIINKLKGNKDYIHKKEYNLNQYIIIDKTHFIENFDEILKGLFVYDHKKYKKNDF